MTTRAASGGPVGQGQTMPRVDASWRLIGSRRAPDRAEFDGEPYCVMLHRVWAAASAR